MNRRANVFGYSLIAALAIAPLPASAEFLTPQDGQLSCLDYDPETQDCASIQRANVLDDGRIVLADETHFIMAGERFAIATGFVASPVDGQLCVDPESVRIRAEPADHPFAQEFAIKAGASLRVAALQGACVEHRKCGPDHAAMFFLDGEPMTDMITRFRVFAPDDPLTGKLKPRRLGPAQIAGMADVEIDDCTSLSN